MWFRKKAPEKAEIFLECAGCGCLVRRARKKVEVIKEGMLLSDGCLPSSWGTTFSVESYCGRCVPPYDLVKWDDGEARYYRTEPARNIAVTEKGKKLGGE